MRASELIKKLTDELALHGDLPVRRCVGDGDDSGEISLGFAIAFDGEDRTQTEYDDAGKSGFKPTRIYLL